MSNTQEGHYFSAYGVIPPGLTPLRAVLNIFTEAKLNPVGVAITAGATAHRVSQSDIRIPNVSSQV
jgi:hypothetical protein